MTQNRKRLWWRRLNLAKLACFSRSSHYALRACWDSFTFGDTMVHINDYAMACLWVWNLPPQSQVSARQSLGYHSQPSTFGRITPISTSQSRHNIVPTEVILYNPISTRSKKFSPKNRKDFGMDCHTPPLKKVKKQGEMPLHSLGPIPLKKCRI